VKFNSKKNIVFILKNYFHFKINYKLIVFSGINSLETINYWGHKKNRKINEKATYQLKTEENN